MDNSTTYRAIAQLLGDEKAAITYRPKLSRVLGSVTATILLQQMNYWWGLNQCKPFYKFRSPCGHGAYKEGDSWVEELGFSGDEFDTAIRRIGTRIKPRDSKLNVLNATEIELDERGRMTNADKLVLYWTGQDHVTHYELNEQLFFNLLVLAHNPFPNQEKPNQEIPNQGKPDFQSGNPLLANQEKPNSIEQRLHRDYTETTEREKAPEPEPFVLPFGKSRKPEDQEVLAHKQKWEQCLDLAPPGLKWLETHIAMYGLKKMMVAVYKAGNTSEPITNKSYVLAIAKRLELRELEVFDDNGNPRPVRPATRSVGRSPVAGNGNRTPAAPGYERPNSYNIRQGLSPEEIAASFERHNARWGNGAKSG
jgi:hypothetical protein